MVFPGDLKRHTSRHTWSWRGVRPKTCGKCRRQLADAVTGVTLRMCPSQRSSVGKDGTGTLEHDLTGGGWKAPLLAGGDGCIGVMEIILHHTYLLREPSIRPERPPICPAISNVGNSETVLPRFANIDAL